MGLLDRILGRPGAGRVDGRHPVSHDGSPAGADWREQAERFGDIRVNVVGESHYQPALRRICGWKPGTDTLFDCMAELEPEPTNPYDRNAIKVRIGDACVGYLSRADALQLGPSIRAAIESQGSGTCRAVISGRADGDTDNLGVFLHLDAQIT